MLDFNADIKKSIKTTLDELQQQKERYIKKIDDVMVAIQSIDAMYKNIHQYDTLITEISTRSEQLQQADNDNKKMLADIEQQLQKLAPKISQIQYLIGQQEILTTSCQDLSRNIQKLRASKEELVNEYDSLSDEMAAIKKSNLYKTLKLLDSDADAFYKRIAEYIVKHVVAQQPGVFGVKEMPLEFYDDEQ